MLPINTRQLNDIDIQAEPEGNRNLPKIMINSKPPVGSDDSYFIKDASKLVGVTTKIFLKPKPKAYIAAWKQDIDTLLVFAGLFSAVVTTFIVESYNSLQPKPYNPLIDLLYLITNSQNNGCPLPPSVNPTSVATLFSQTPSPVRVNVLWFISLTLALATMLLGLVTLQYLRKQSGILKIYHQENSHLRLKTLEGYATQVFAAIPLLLQTALVLFLAGLIDFILPPESKLALLICGCITAIAILPVFPTFRSFFQFFPSPTLTFNLYEDRVYLNEPNDVEESGEKPEYTTEMPRNMKSPGLETSYTLDCSPAPSNPDGDPWEILLRPELEADTARCKAWKEEAQILLVFAGLFAGVVATFVIESYKSLQPDSNDTIIALLFLITKNLKNTSPSPLSIDPPTIAATFSPTPSSLRTNAFWFLSLILSITTFLIGITSLQWLREHQRYPHVSPKEKLEILHMRSEALEAWYVPQFFAALPVLLQGSLALFLAGLIDFVLPLGPKTFTIPIFIIIGLAFLFLAATTVLPICQGFLFLTGLYPYGKPPTPCAFKSPQSNIILTTFAPLLRILSYLTSSVQYLFNSSSLLRRYDMPSYLRQVLHQTTWPTVDRKWLTLRDAYRQCILDKDPHLYHHQRHWKDSFPLSDMTQYIIKVIKENPTAKHTEAFLSASVHCFVLYQLASWTEDYVRWAQSEKNTSVASGQQRQKDVGAQYISIFRLVANLLNAEISDSALNPQENTSSALFYLASIFIWELLDRLAFWKALPDTDSSIGRGLGSLLDILLQYVSWNRTAGRKNDAIETRFKEKDYSAWKDKHMDRFSDEWWDILFELAHKSGLLATKQSQESVLTEATVPEPSTEPSPQEAIPSENKADILTTPSLPCISPSVADHSLKSNISSLGDNIVNYTAIPGTDLQSTSMTRTVFESDDRDRDRDGQRERQTVPALLTIVDHTTAMNNAVGPVGNPLQNVPHSQPSPAGSRAIRAVNAHHTATEGVVQIPSGTLRRRLAWLARLRNRS